MFHIIHLIKTIPALTTSINRSPRRHGFHLIALALVWLAFLATARAQCGLGCDFNGNVHLGDQSLTLTTGGYNTATGDSALANSTTGSADTANGNEALFNNKTGDENIAIGFEALIQNTTGSFNTATGDFTLFGNQTGSK